MKLLKTRTGDVAHVCPDDGEETLCGTPRSQMDRNLGDVFGPHHVGNLCRNCRDAWQAMGWGERRDA